MSDAPRPSDTRQGHARPSFGLWLETAPAGVLTAAFIPVFFLIAGGCRLAFARPLPFVPDGPLGLIVLAAISIAAASTVPKARDAQQRARPGGRITVDVWRAVSNSRLPDDADPAVWRSPVEQYAAAFRTGQENLPKALLGLVILVLVGFFIQFVPSPHGTAGWCALVIAVVLGIAILVRRRQLPPRIDAVLAQLAELEARRADPLD
ncbi:MULTISPECIES: hypothetical protein [Clavibacter]|uniref:Uncharacterized protein n=1 Tax=Clavibacter tessellarius TaxID=31965 RepID=A0A154UZB5_9MICO|nr:MULTISPECIES: hypothetical protein [Clavibacter]KZC94462.1 hypothetical protein AWH51_13150 [Clavibacter michiganensis subsp. tessellarius]MDA3805819.1 hypothetical protein [Clavibacter sp. CT19]